MNSPRSSFVSTKGVAVPLSFACQIPSDPAEVLRLIKLFRRKPKSSRAYVETIEREKWENKLMSFEDILYTDEYKLRAVRCAEEVNMQAEDLLSSKIETEYRRLQNMSMADKVKAEVEARKLAEEKEKLEKRRLAEERRKAVVDRIRQAQEEEARKAREAELALQKLREEERIAAEKARVALMNERTGFAMEDELSKLHEQELKEAIARRLWLEKERKKQEEIEFIQREKERIEALERENRLAELEEKKKRLKELRESQPEAASKEEAEKLNKQLRIQNKAKNVTRKIKDGETSQTGRRLSGTVDPESVAPLESSEVDVDQMFLDVLEGCKNENDIRKQQKCVMSEKRGLRLKLQKLQQQSQQQDNTAVLDELREAQKGIQIATKKENMLQGRLKELKTRGSKESPQKDVPSTESSQSLRELNQKAENLLREAHSLTIGNGESTRSSIILIMEFTEIMKQFDSLRDELGYVDRLKSSLEALKGLSGQPQGTSTENAAHSKSIVTFQNNDEVIQVQSISDLGIEQVTERKNVSCEFGDTRQSDSTITLDFADSPTRGPVPEIDLTTKHQDSFDFDQFPGWKDCLYTSMCTAAHHAAYYGYPDILELLTQIFDCFVADKKGRTPLYYAALANRLDCVAIMVSINPLWIDVGDVLGDTPIHAAAVANGSEVLGFLLDACEVSPDTANYDGLTPSHVASSREALTELYNHGALPYCVDLKNRMPNHLACAEGRVDCVGFLCSVTPSKFLMWSDNDGNTCLHVAASAGQSECVEEICRWVQGMEELCIPNKKSFTPAHVSKNQAVLKALYENGADLWITDSKGHFPLFVACFYGRLDCVAFLLELAISSNKLSLVSSKDTQGDTVLHAAALCGKLPCVELLLYFLRDEQNRAGLRCSELAIKAGHERIAALIRHAEERFAVGDTAEGIFCGTFDVLSTVLQCYGSRWTKLFDASSSSVYYFDRVGGVSQWERPNSYDESHTTEMQMDQARELLVCFYKKYNESKLSGINDILFAYQGKYTELFISLANKYEVEDLSMFSGISFD